MLIAVNPFKVLNIYGSDAVNFYRGAEDTDDIGVPENGDRATRCTTAQMPADILENRRRSRQLQTPSETGMFKNMKVRYKKHDCIQFILFFFNLSHFDCYMYCENTEVKLYTGFDEALHFCIRNLNIQAVADPRHMMPWMT